MRKCEERVLWFEAVRNGEVPACLSCEHFRQHYTRNPETLCYMWVNCGHCTFPRLKHRKPYDVCEHYKAMDKMDVALRMWVDEMEELHG